MKKLICKKSKNQNNSHGKRSGTTINGSRWSKTTWIMQWQGKAVGQQATICSAFYIASMMAGEEHGRGDLTAGMVMLHHGHDACCPWCSQKLVHSTLVLCFFIKLFMILFTVLYIVMSHDLLRRCVLWYGDTIGTTTNMCLGQKLGILKIPCHIFLEREKKHHGRTPYIIRQ